jgi:hypothetical protein
MQYESKLCLFIEQSSPYISVVKSSSKASSVSHRTWSSGSPIPESKLYK